MEAAFFDLDKTIIAKSGPLALGRSFMREGMISRSLVLKSIYAQLMFQLMGADEEKMERMKTEAAKLTQGWEADKVRKVVNEVLEEVISPLIYAEALELIHDHRAAGRLVCIVSSSPEEIVEPLARMLRIEQFIATKPKIVDGLYTGELEFYAYGPHKPTAIRELAEQLNIELEGSFAYTDSVTDLPMLELVGHPVAVNPDRELRRIALERGWRLEIFRNPVSLRSRLPNFRTPQVTVTSGAGTLAGVVGVAALAWWLARRSTVGEAGWAANVRRQSPPARALPRRARGAWDRTRSAR